MTVIKLPGKIIDSTKQIDAKIENLILGGKSSFKEALRTWTRLDSQVFDFLTHSPESEFWVSYHHPVLKNRKALSLAGKNELLAYLHKHIQPSRAEGLDIVVASTTWSFCLVFNHDGEVFLINNASK